MAVAGRDIVGEHEQETADSPTRDRVMSSILHNGPSTASELADRLGLTAAAVRRHLSALVSRGLVDSREKKVFGARGRGRPSRVFFLTDHGRADYYTAYDDLAISALRQLADAAGPLLLTRWLRLESMTSSRVTERCVRRAPTKSRLSCWLRYCRPTAMWPPFNQLVRGNRSVNIIAP